MLQTKISEAQVRQTIQEQLVYEINRLINIASRGVHKNQSIQLKRYFVGNLIKTDTFYNLLFPFDRSFAEVLEHLDLNIELHREYIELCVQLLLIFMEKRWDDSCVIHEQFKIKLTLLTEHSQTLENICLQIQQAVEQQSEALQALWGNYVQVYKQKLLEQSEVSFSSSEENLSVSVMEQLQHEQINQQVLSQLQEELLMYQRCLQSRGSNLPSFLYQNTCRVLSMDATQERIDQVSEMLIELNKEITNYQFFALLSKYKNRIKDSYGILNRHKSSALYQLLEKYSFEYEDKLRKHIMMHKMAVTM